MIENEAMPHAAVIPVLGYRDVRAAVEWLVSAFGFTERLRIADHRAQLAYGSGAVVVAEGPVSAAGGDHSIMVRVADVDAHYLHAKQASARILDVDPVTWGGALVDRSPGAA